MMQYVIGDVHGEYKTLMALIDKLPKDAELIFVGDLVDRGLESKQVVEFVRENKCLCVKGNHEQMMIDAVNTMLKTFPFKINIDPDWYMHGGIETLLSYNVVRLRDRKVLANEDRYYVKQLISDIDWLDTLPHYIELPQKINEKPVVVSHAPSADVWNNNNERFIEDNALWNRKVPSKDAPIFNIFGHTPTKDGVNVSLNYVNVDTGCYMSKGGYGKLSAFCIQTQEVFSVERVC